MLSFVLSGWRLKVTGFRSFVSWVAINSGFSWITFRSSRTHGHLCVVCVWHHALHLIKRKPNQLLEFSTPIVRAAALRLAAQQPFERLPELRAEYRIYDGVQRWVEVAEPQEQGGQIIVDGARLARYRHHHHDEKRQPAHDERAGDNRQRFGRLPFALRLERLFARSHLSVRITGGSSCRWSGRAC